jgi:hypothetical protein
LGTKALKGIKQGAEFISKIKPIEPLADSLGRAFIYRFGQSPVYAKMAEKTITAIARGQEAALDLGKAAFKVGKVNDVKIAEYLKGNINDLPPDLMEIATNIRNGFKTEGERAVRNGLLDAETYIKNMDTYVPRLYDKHEIPKAFQGFLVGVKPQRANLNRFLKREDISKDVREAMGEIMTSGYPTAKGLAQLRQANELTEFFGKVNVKWGSKVLQEGMEKLPNTKRLGALAGQHVPKAIADDINEIIRVPSGLEKKLSRAVATFKFGKVVMNPATHSRNILSNFLLNDFAGLSPARVDIYAKAARSLIKKDDLYKEAVEQGLGLNTLAANEMKNLLTPSGRVGELFKAGTDKLSSIYQKEEEFAKMAQYIFQRGKGLSPEDAFKIAQDATFNYAQVTPFIRRLRQSAFGFPFITFTYKATPAVAKTLITNPGKISKIGKIARGVESLTPSQQREQERAVEPDYIRNGYFVRLPNADKYGRAGYFDLTYIIPFGDLVSGNFFIAPRSGENIIQSVLRQQPLLNAVAEISANRDFFDKPIVQVTSLNAEDQAMDLFKYVAKFYGPPALMDFPFRLAQSAEFEKKPLSEIQFGEGRTQQTKTVAQEALRGLLGLKVQPFDLQSQKTFSDNEKRKKLQDFLEAKGYLAKFTRPFVPK